MSSSTLYIPSFIDLSVGDFLRLSRDRETTTSEVNARSALPPLAIAASSALPIVVDLTGVDLSKSPQRSFEYRPREPSNPTPRNAMARYCRSFRNVALGSMLALLIWPSSSPQTMVSSALATGSENRLSISTSVAAEVNPPPMNQRLAVHSSDTEHRNLSLFLATRYKIVSERAEQYVRLAFETAKEIDLDPWLILAIMSIESSLNPNAMSPVGAQGLMQVHTRVHADKFKPHGGTQYAFDPRANIRVGAGILRGYIDRHGSVASALKAYVGAALLPDDGGYGAKVLFEYDRLSAVALGLPFRQASPTMARKMTIQVPGGRGADLSAAVASDGSQTDRAHDAMALHPTIASVTTLTESNHSETGNSRSESSVATTGL